MRYTLANTFVGLVTGVSGVLSKWKPGIVDQTRSMVT